MRHFEEEQVDELMAIKNITNRNNCYYVRKLVRELHSWRHTLVYLEAQKNIRYDRNRGDH